MKHLIFIGAPGSGKGTQASKVKKECGYVHVSTGDLLRAEIAKESELGKKVKGVLDAGQLVDDQTVLSLIKANVELAQKGYIFDGYPRNETQAAALDSEILGAAEYVAIYFKVNEDEIVNRLANRRVTKDGKQIYNLISNPPKTEGVCDVTGQELIQRDDDKEEVIRKRLEVYSTTVGPMLDYYRAKGVLVELDASKPMDEIFGGIKDVL